MTNCDKCGRPNQNPRPIYNGLCFTCFMGYKPMSETEQREYDRRMFDHYERNSF